MDYKRLGVFTIFQCVLHLFFDHKLELLNYTLLSCEKKNKHINAINMQLLIQKNNQTR